MSSPSPPPPPPETDLSPEQLRARALALLPAPAARVLEKEEQLGPVLHALFETSTQGRTRFEVSDDDFLEALKRVHMPAALPEKMAAFGIRSGTPQGWQRLFMTHPPLEERIAALKQTA